jgi:hypothetical protein
MKRDYELLTKLKNDEGYKRLMVLWLEEVTEIESRRDSAAQRGQESAWRYAAGMEKGAKRMMMLLDIEIARMEKEGGEFLEEPSDVINRLLAEVKPGENK